MADPEGGDGDGEEDEVWDITELLRNSERGVSALDCVESVCESGSLAVPTTAVETQQRIMDSIHDFVGDPMSETSLRTKEALLVSVNKD